MAKGKARQERRADAKGTGVPRSSAIRFTGPIRNNGPTGNVEDSVVEVMSFAQFTGGSSVGLQNYQTATNVTNCADWSSFVTVYDECRVLGIELDWFPSTDAGNSTVVHSAGLAVTTHSPVNPFPFTSITSMSDYNWKPFHTGKPLKLTWKMDSTEEAQFVPTSAVVSQGALGFWAPYATTTASNSYGMIVVTFKVQFRGRK